MRSAQGSRLCAHSLFEFDGDPGAGYVLGPAPTVSMECAYGQPPVVAHRGHFRLVARPAPTRICWDRQ